MMLQRGSPSATRRCGSGVLKFGQSYANGLRRRCPRPGGTWHLDEVFITINGKRHYLWRAVVQHGTGWTFWSPPDATSGAATRFFVSYCQDCGPCPRVLVTDKLGSYDAT